MTYRYVFTESFRHDIREQLIYWREQQVPETTTQAWFSGLFDVFETLETNPRLHPIDVYETEEVEEETRKIAHGDYLVFYTVDDENKEVNITAFTHGATRKDAWDREGDTKG